jgi:hypothetical protein
MVFGLHLRNPSSTSTYHFSTSTSASSLTSNEDTTISRETLERLAQLVKLSIREEDAPKLGKDLESVLKFVERWSDFPISVLFSHLASPRLASSHLTSPPTGFKD